MEIGDYLEKKRTIQRKLIDYLDNSENAEENFQDLLDSFQNPKFHEDRKEIEEFLHLISIISEYHHRTPNFFEKIERVLSFFQSIIQKYLTNQEIFVIFKSSKRILLFLIESHIITVDSSIASQIMKNNFLVSDGSYKQYFYNEIKSFISEDEIKNIEIPNSENFEENRKIGENSEYICQLIRNDDIKEFIVYVNKNSISLNKTIPNNIFETNSFFFDRYKNDNTLIAYAAFFGSIQIFRYLLLNGVNLNKNTWNYAVHGGNGEIIHLIEENGIEPPLYIYESCLDHSIKSHQIDVTNYLLNNYFLDEEIHNNLKYEHLMKLITKLNDYPGFDPIELYTSLPSYQYYNFIFFPDKLDSAFNFYYLCYYNYINFVNILLNTKKIMINQRVVR
ncbi:hypothetical protein M9Y10_010936 [Tritrichomonas musculus]|uniref:DUF3447 domain-containing protein n=1 Tax=Tritrichomonas musculus TaxID=1915356 RepID=A0ABR2IMZ2_9EUKA